MVLAMIGTPRKGRTFFLRDALAAAASGKDADDGAVQARRWPSQRPSRKLVSSSTTRFWLAAVSPGHMGSDSKPS